MSSNILGKEVGHVPLGELVENQALNVGLREAVMACLSGRESRRWTVLELVERLKNLGVRASRAGVTAALAELALELELSGWAPWRLLERGTPMDPRAQIRALRASFWRQRAPLGKSKDPFRGTEGGAPGRHRLPPQRGSLQNEGGGDSRVGSLSLPG